MKDGPSGELVARIRDVLGPIAAAGGTITYSELRAALPDLASVPDRGPGDLASLLRAASESAEAAGIGLISAVVVGPSRRPGAGWFRLAESMGRDLSDPEAGWQAERIRLRERLR